MLNKVILQGNIGNTPKIYLIQEGKEVANFSLATTMVWKDKKGEWQSATDWHQITVFRESTVRWIKDLLKQGDSVYVEGKLVYQHWTDKYDQTRITAHVVVPGQGGKVEYLRFSRSNSQNNPVKTEAGQDNTLPNMTSSPRENEYNCSISVIPDEDSSFIQLTQNKGEKTYEH